VTRSLGPEFALEAPVGNVVYRAASLGPICRVSPGGALIAVVERGSATAEVVILDLQGNVVRRSNRFEDAASMLAWSRDEEVVATVEDGLVGIGIDGRDRTIQATPGGIGIHDVARDGTMVLEQGSWRSTFAVGHDGRFDEQSWMDATLPVDLSRSGRSAIFAGRTPDGKLWGAYIKALDQSAPVYLGHAQPLAILPDESGVLALSPANRLLLISTGVGATRDLGPWTGAKLQLSPAAISPDGKVAYLQGAPPGAAKDLYRLPLDGSAPSPLNAPPVLDTVRVSPDGTLLAVHAPDYSTAILNLTIAGGLTPVPGTVVGDWIIGWSANSRAVFIATNALDPEIYRVELSSGKRELVRRFHVDHPNNLVGFWATKSTDDAEAILFRLVRATNSDLWIAEGLR